VSNTGIIDEEKTDLLDRLELYAGRLATIPEEKTVKEPFSEFFEKEAEFLTYILQLYKKLNEEDKNSISIEELQERNKKLYEELFAENYNKCFGDPDYACARLGKEYGPVFSAIYAELRGVIVYIYEDRLWDLVVCIELFLECLSAFLDEELPSPESIKNIFVSYNYDYCARFVSDRVAQQVDPENDFAVRIIMESDLNDLRYLYSFGEYISENEIKTAEFLNSLSQEDIDAMARTFTEGYRMGFAATGKDITKKKSVNIRYSIGFERMIRSAVLMFEAMGLKPVIYRAASHCVGKGRVKVGYFGGDANPQFWFDHTGDEALYLDERFVTRKLSSMHEAFEERKSLSNTHGGPACIDVFGEKPFIPEVKKNALSLSDKQRELKVRYDSEAAQIVNRYIIGEERSYTIIAYPLPEIGPDYEEIFRQTAKINTLDYKTYQKIQQGIIDVLDKGDVVVIKGRGDNLTDLTVKLHELKDPSKQTNFENCVADVNIPVGEVFTSPVLKGTNGLLHVSEVYLEGLRFEDLKIHVSDGMTAGYSCGNFEDPADGEKYIRENILFQHESLPMGEFAIGTNTTAYAMANKFGIFEKLPILIAEKTGPHFAFGDTCYSREEDLETYNPDGKAIIARENEVSALRKTNISKAYFNCHTDVTIPYDELGCIYVVTANGEKIYIINDGKFVLDGTQELNIPLEEAKRNLA
jgi:aminopeptidase